MTVVAFAHKDTCQSGNWPAGELSELVGKFSAELASGKAGGWDTGATEMGDPQFYLVGQTPHEDCILCVSRLGRVYVLEDGAGRILFEDVKFERIAEQAKAYLKRSKSSLVAQIAVVYAVARQTFEEKVEPLMAEGEEFLLHFAPQLAALV
jgi:hypothetical protein